MIDKYIVRIRNRIVGDDELKAFFDVLDKSDIKKSIIFLNDNYVLYYKKVDDGVSVMIKSDRKNIGALKFYEKSLVKKVMRFKFDKLDEIFELAEEIEEMSIDEFMRFVRKEV